MSWTLPRRRVVNKRVVMNYMDLTQNRAQGTVFKQLGGPVFVETNGNQGRAFTQFLGRNYINFSSLEKVRIMLLI
jgi:hypothetical protein